MWCHYATMNRHLLVQYRIIHIMNKMIPTAILGVAATVCLVTSCSSDQTGDLSSMNSAASAAAQDGADAVASASASASSTKQLTSAQQAIVNKFDDAYKVGQTFEYNENMTASVDAVSIVNTPLPACAGSYYAVTMTFTNNSPLPEYPTSAPTSLVVGGPSATFYDAQGKSEAPRTGPPELAPEYNPSPIYCPAGAWAQTQVKPAGGKLTEKIYSLINKDIGQPTHVYIRCGDGTKKMVELPAEIG